MPLRTAIEGVIAATRAYVGAGRVLRVLNIDPLVAEPDVAAALAGHASTPRRPREWPVASSRPTGRAS